MDILTASAIWHILQLIVSNIPLHHTHNKNIPIRRPIARRYTALFSIYTQNINIHTGELLNVCILSAPSPDDDARPRCPFFSPRVLYVCICCYTVSGYSSVLFIYRCAVPTQQAASRRYGEHLTSNINT